jgi:hypothetical protein
VFSGVDALGTLQTWLNTGKCEDKTVRVAYVLLQISTVAAVLTWFFVTAHMLDVIDLGKPGRPKSKIRGL